MPDVSVEELCAVGLARQPITARTLLGRRLNNSSSLKLDVDRVCHFQEERAWILHPPFCVRNREMPGSAPAFRLEFHVKRYGKVVICSMDPERSVHLQR
jgi:hypothetical protein